MNFFNFLPFVDVKCGDNIVIAEQIASVIRVIYNGIKIGVPIILIVVGMIGMGKAIASQKEDDIKKAQNTLIKQAIAAVIVFLMFYLVQLVMGVIGENKGTNWDCVDQLLNGSKPAEESEEVKKEKSKHKDGDPCNEEGLKYAWNDSAKKWECK